MKWLKLVLSIAISFAASIIGSLFTMPDPWYATLTKPVFSPPNWIFGPVWTLLYLLIGISLYLVWEKGLDHRGVKFALCVFASQWFLNAIWTPVFFGAHSIFYSLMIIMLMWAAIVFTITAFYRVSRTAAYLLIPYLLWVSFAMVLNFALFVLN